MNPDEGERVAADGTRWRLTPGVGWVRLPDPDHREEVDAGLRTVRAVLAVTRGPNLRGSSSVPVACPHCGAYAWSPCLALGTGRPLLTIHPSRVDAAARRDDTGAAQ